MLSNNGTNFVAVERELRELAEKLDHNQITQSVANKGVIWHLFSTGTPFWRRTRDYDHSSLKTGCESSIGQRRCDGRRTDDSVTGSNALLNSRSLTNQSANLDDDAPNPFLIGHIGGQFAPESVDETRYNLKKRWRRVQELVRQFWHRWLREWIPGLNCRRQWLREERNLKKGEVVLVISPNTPRWTLASWKNRRSSPWKRQSR